MNKTNLKQRWGKYTDTDKLVDDIMKLLTECHFRNSEHGVCTELDTYFTNKEPLIKLFQKSKNYIGDMRIAVEEEFERHNDGNVIRNVVNYFGSDVGAAAIIKKKQDKFGKTIEDYLYTGVTHIKATDLENKSTLKKFTKRKESIVQFNSDGYTYDSCDKYWKFDYAIRGFGNINVSNLTEEHVAEILKRDNTLKIKAGMKTSRAFNHLCHTYGVDESERYNKAFAKYADLVSGIKRKLKFVISLNPYDYLTMSFGNSWSSCHNIKNHGGWCGGTLSYMLDSTSIITYCVGKDDNVQTDDKIYRNMFAYGENMLLQSRIYPQGNDGNTDLYGVFRRLVQAELAELLELKNNAWYTNIGPSVCKSVTVSSGVHYKDYHSNQSANISYPVEKANEIKFDHALQIGHRGICAHCGEYIDSSSTVSHSSCLIRTNNVATLDASATVGDLFDWLDDE